MTFKKIAAHTEVAENLNDDPTTPYIYFELPGDLSAKGRQTERFLYVRSPVALMPSCGTPSGP